MKKINALFPEFLILFICLLLCAAVWPMGLLSKSDYTSASIEKGMILSDPISEENAAVGTFIPAHRTLNSLSFRFNKYQDIYAIDGTLEFYLENAAGQVLFHTSIPCEELPHEDFYDIPIDCKLTTGETYSYRIFATDYTYQAPKIYLSSAGVGPVEQTGLSFHDIPSSKYAVIRFSYTDKASPRKAIPYYITILFLTSLALFACKRKNEPEFKILGAFHTIRHLSIYTCFVLICAGLILLSDESQLPVTEEGGTCTTRALDAGSYYIGVEYNSTTPGNTVSILANGTTLLCEELPVSETYINFPVILDKDCQKFQIEYSTTDSSDCTIVSTTLNTYDHFYYDTYFYVIVFILLTSGLALCLCKRATILSHRTQLVTGGILLSIALVSFLPYCNGILPAGDDLSYHLARIEGIKDGLRNGQFPVYILPEALQGYGYLNSMYPSLFLYLPALLRLMGISIITVYKSFVLLILLATVFLTYFSVKSIYPSRSAALLAALLYSLCPYHLVNLYARGALGESLAMTFLPLAFAGLYHLLEGDSRKWWMLALAMSGLLQSHTLFTLLTGLLCVAGGLIFFENIRMQKRWIPICKAILSVFLLNAWFLVPFLYYYRKGGLWMDALGTTTYRERALVFSNLFGSFNLENYRTLSLGLPLILLAGFSLVYLIFYSKQHTNYGHISRKFLSFLLAMGVLSAFMSTGNFNAWSFMELPVFDWLFTTIQFPSRLLAFASTALIFVGAIALYETEKLHRIRPVITVACCTICLLTIMPYHNDWNYYKTKYDTASVNHVSKLIGIDRGDYESIYPNEWRRQNFNNDIPLDGGNLIHTSNDDMIKITDFSRIGTTSTLAYSASDGISIEFPIQYYPGYIAYDENHNALDVIPSENQLVSVYAVGDGASHIITVKYHKNALFLIAEWISVICILLPLLLFYRKRKGSLK